MQVHPAEPSFQNVVIAHCNAAGAWVVMVSSECFSCVCGACEFDYHIHMHASYLSQVRDMQHAKL